MLTMLRAIALGGIATLILASCASISTEECTRGDWNQIGYRDGSTGASTDVLAQHEKACAEVKVRADVNAWKAGYDRGVLVYCTPDNGFEVGLRDGMYRGVCPPHLEPGFRARYAAGNHVYKARRILDQYDRDISSLNRELNQRDLPPARRGDLMNRLMWQQQARMQAALQVNTIEAWARGIYVAPPPLAPYAPR
jgi:hypothetical protein